MSILRCVALTSRIAAGDLLEEYGAEAASEARSRLLTAAERGDDAAHGVWCGAFLVLIDQLRHAHPRPPLQPG